MQRRTKWIAGSALAAAVLVGGAGVAIGTVDDDGSEKPITGPALDRASAAALEHIGGGRVTDTEVGDEEGYYEVEVTLDGGREVDVHLDENFNVLSDEVENEADED